MFFGIIIEMRFNEHNPPHLHASYQNDKAVYDFDGELLKGSLPRAKERLVIAWIELHRDELKADWALAQLGKSVFRIEPLK
jgi:hypothetical protein